MAVFFPKGVIGILVASIPLSHAFVLTHWKDKVKVSASRMRQPNRKLQEFGCDEILELFKLGASAYDGSCSSSCEENTMGFTFECSNACSTCYTFESGSTVCSRDSFYNGQFDSNGTLTSSVVVEEITQGGGEGVSPILGTEIRFEDGLSGCAYIINGEKCTSCTYQTCDDDSSDFLSFFGDALFANCSNVVANSIYDDCTDTFTGVFEYMGTPEEYVDCDVPHVSPTPSASPATEKDDSSGTSTTVITWPLLACVLVSVLCSSFFM